MTTDSKGTSQRLSWGFRCCLMRPLAAWFCQARRDQGPGSHNNGNERHDTRQRQETRGVVLAPGHHVCFFFPQTPNPQKNPKAI